jgi:hypothetical protein
VVDFRGLDAAGDERVPAISADDEPLLLRNSGTCLGVAANAGDPVAVPNERLHREALSQLDTIRHGGVDEDLIEYNTPRAVCLGNARRCRRSTRQGEGTSRPCEARTLSNSPSPGAGGTPPATR